MRFVFRYRYLLHTLVYGLGFFAPWNFVVRLDQGWPNEHVWEVIPRTLVRAGLLDFATDFHIVLALGILLAFAGAFLRTWGAAYLGSSVVKSSAMHTAEIPGHAAAETTLFEDGPFRHLRNPLYVGTCLHTLALVLIMPPSGAVFTLVCIGALQALLIGGEERFLSERLGQKYAAYCALVPRLWPRLRAQIKGTGARARWPQAMLGEVYFWAFAGSLAVLSWAGNALIMERALLVCFGISLVVRALLPKPAAS